MPSTLTPIRYPGGKTKIYPLVRKIMEENALLGGTYCEPFAGGAGLAIKLLLNDDVKNIVINDLDPAIYAVWHSILFETESLCRFIQNVELTISEWDRQKEIYLNPQNYDIGTLGNATLFLNRTNVSGVITGGVIGGRKQEGNYKMGARFNRESLTKKIKAIAEHKNQIEIYNMDVNELIKSKLPSLGEKSLVNFDPPYVKKGGELYKNSFTEDDHRNLRDNISSYKGLWIVTYDVCDFISSLYSGYKKELLDVYYSAKTVTKAKEYIFYSSNLSI